MQPMRAPVRRLPASAIAAITALLLTAGPLSAYSLNYYNGHYTSEFPENITCVSASAVTEINYINADTTTADYSHTIAQSWYNLARGSTDHDKYDYNNPFEPGLDPRAWAWLLWDKSPPHYGYHDYWNSSQSTVDSWLMYDLRDSDPAAGVIVFRGIHAIDVIGFSSSMDPDLGPATLTGFYIDDPWTGGTNPQKTELDGGTLGLPPDTWLSTSTWNASYMLPYADSKYEGAHGNTIWHGKYVVVLRTVDDTPQPTPSYDTMPTKYSDTHDGGNFAITMGSDPGTGTVDAAITSGIESAQIDASRFGIDLQHVRIGRTLHVGSLGGDVKPYDLVEVMSRGRVAAIAMLTSESDGLHLAGLQTSYPGNALKTQGQAAVAFAGKGALVSSSIAEWAPSAASFEPFSPLFVGSAPGGGQLMLTPDGQVTTPSALSLP